MNMAFLIVFDGEVAPYVPSNRTQTDTVHTEVDICFVQFWRGFVVTGVGELTS